MREVGAYGAADPIGELRELVALVLADAGDADRAEALATAMKDPASALESYRALAAELGMKNNGFSRPLS